MLCRRGGVNGRREHRARHEQGGDDNAQHRPYGFARSSAASNVSVSYESSCLLPLT
jgi:hypothetical protein